MREAPSTKPEGEPCDCWGETRHPFYGRPKFCLGRMRKEFFVLSSCATQSTSHVALLEKLGKSFFLRLVFSVIFEFGILVDLPQNLHRDLLGLSAGCKGSIDRLLLERQMKCWICLIPRQQMNICCHLGEEKGKRRQRVEEWRNAFRKPHEILYLRYNNSLLLPPSRTLHETSCVGG